MDLNLESINILIGSNSSGKSNFLKIFEFIREIVDWGLENAISRLGGPDYLLNINLKDRYPLKFYLLADLDWYIESEFEKNKIHIEYTDLDYEFEIKFNDNKFLIKKDILTLGLRVIQNDEDINKKDKKGQKNPSFKLSYNKKEDNIAIDIKDEKGKILEETSISNVTALKILTNIINQAKKPINYNDLLITNSISYAVIGLPLLSDIMIYDFDVKLITEAVPFLGFSDLEDDGSNLTIILKNILDDEEESRKFYNLLNSILPFLKTIQVEKFLDSSYFFKIKEIYSESYLPGSFSSEGTVAILALIVALYFEKFGIILIEEPGKLVHPYIISKIVDFLLDASSEKQIFITTHNPLLIKGIDLKSIFLVSRNKDGFSEISNLDNSERTKIFLKNELGIDDLFIENLLGE